MPALEAHAHGLATGVGNRTWAVDGGGWDGRNGRVVDRSDCWERNGLNDDHELG